jgi:glycosyltransferase involved in cell wall biosynthesis
MPVSVIITTFNNPAWLEKAVWGWQAQTVTDFELVIADDGSGSETDELIARLRKESPFPIRHVRHDHEGFRKCTIMNRAIMESAGDYLIFSDGDCIPRADFVAVHLAKRAPGAFVSGGYCRLPLEASKAISRDDVFAQKPFDTRWLREYGFRKVPLKLRTRGRLARFFNSITPTNPSWNGHNASGWKNDIVAVNGFNEVMGYGGEDREHGERLVNLGIKPVQVRHLAICVHLDHGHGYRHREIQDKNLLIRRENRRTGRTWTETGIVKGPRPTA